MNGPHVDAFLHWLVPRLEEQKAPCTYKPWGRDIDARYEKPKLALKLSKENGASFVYYEDSDKTLTDALHAEYAAIAEAQSHNTNAVAYTEILALFGIPGGWKKMPEPKVGESLIAAYQRWELAQKAAPEAREAKEVVDAMAAKGAPVGTMTWGGALYAADEEDETDEIDEKDLEPLRGYFVDEGKNYRCRPCGVLFRKSKLGAHQESETHKAHVEVLKNEGENAFWRPAMAGKEFCTVCNVDIAVHMKERHLEGLRHRKAVVEHVTKQKKAAAV